MSGKATPSIHPPGSLSSTVSSLIRAQHGSALDDVDDSDMDKRIAEIMVQDAKERQKQWGVSGYTAYIEDDDSDAPKRKTNKRFLTSMIRNVDTHNQALIQQELEAAQRAQREAERASRSKRDDPSARSSRLFGSAMTSASRPARSSASALDKGKQRERDDDDERRHRSNGSSRRRARSCSRDARRLRDGDGERTSRRRHSRSRSPRPERDERERERSSRHRSRRDDEDTESRSHRRHRDEERSSHRRHRDRDEDDRDESKKRRRRLGSSSPDEPEPQRSRKERSRMPSPSPLARPPSPPRATDLTHNGASTTLKLTKADLLEMHPTELFLLNGSVSPPRSPTPPPQPPPQRRKRSLTPVARVRAPSHDDDDDGDLPAGTIRPPPATSAGPSKMDKYFEAAYDPRLDVSLADMTDPTTGLIAEGAFDDWNTMLELMKARKDYKRDKHIREAEEKYRAEEAEAAKKERKRRAKEEEKDRKRRRKLGVESDEDDYGPQPPPTKVSASTALAAPSAGMFGYRYVKKGGTREWDLGKETPT